MILIHSFIKFILELSMIEEIEKRRKLILEIDYKLVVVKTFNCI